ncbi:WD40 repeat-like protein [Aureobasidium subglaciale]|nr:WD40 repeat-like protein [Aureobasidium subglaciale]KAI5226455.1 WD40 repeat-like protein [Aureobasidium subglaciale]KAI5229825.1 WD40 repeat-like protein [Aureobasidium subglaciale]KAI5264379.1 WD40 repeat-like protein [Aureobasidium subglaciale]
MEKFLREYVYQVETDFSVDGESASWAPTRDRPAHRFWDDEDDKIDLRFSNNESSRLSSFAVSHDEKYVAYSDGSIVGVSNIETRAQRTLFRGLTLPCVNLMFSPALNESGGYTLLVESSDRDEDEQALLFLTLDGDGKLRHNPDVVDVQKLLQSSLYPVMSEMNDFLNIGPESPLLEMVRQGYLKTLEKLRASVESRNLPNIPGCTSGFGSNPSTSDGRLFLYLIQNETTQSGSRPAAELPKVIVHDVVNNRLLHTLSGHEDAIMWTAFSPNDQYIATAAWDGTFRIYNVSSGDCKHIIGPTGGQCWSGAWSPDSKHILLSGMTDEGEGEGFRNNTFVAVYSVETAQQINRFKHERLRSWVRCVAWSPKGDIAIVHETNLWIWDPFENEIVSEFSLKIDDRMMGGFAGFRKVQWVNNGDVLIVRAGDGTVEVWDRVGNTKYRLQRPKGSGIERDIRAVQWIQKDKTLRTLSSDGFMRMYRFA